MSYTEKMTEKVGKITEAFTEKLTEETLLIMWLESELKECRSELCLRCGKYRVTHDGTTECEIKGCRWL